MAEHPALGVLSAIPEGEFPTLEQVDYLLIMTAAADRTSQVIDLLLDMRSALTALAAAGALAERL